MFLNRLNPIRRTITFRLVFWYSGIFILSTSFLFILAYVLLSSSVRQHDRDDIRQQLGEYATRYRAGGLDTLAHEVALEKRSVKGHPFFVRVADAQGRTLLLDNPEQRATFDLTRLESDSINGSSQWIEMPNRNGDRVLEIESTLLGDGIVLQVGKSTEDREELLERFREIFASIMIPVVLVGIVGGSFLAFRTLSPIRSLINTVRSVSTGAMNARVPTRQTGDELDELVMLFNAMLEKIETLINGMRNSLDNVAHDLRTPMTRLRGTAELALRLDHDREVYREALADCVEESDRVLTMLNTLMDISEAETGTMKLQPEEVHIASLIEDTVELYSDVAEDKNITLHVTAPRELFLIADRNRLRQVLANLLDNAIKYTPTGGRVDLEASVQDEEAIIVVRDTGIGISAEETARVWDRLYRGDKSRSQRGLGLGLSLVKAVVQAHHGRIEVSSHPGQGALFILYLPTASAPTG